MRKFILANQFSSHYFAIVIWRKVDGMENKHNKRSHDEVAPSGDTSRKRPTVDNSSQRQEQVTQQDKDNAEEQKQWKIAVSAIAIV
jgi:hypothetical protein